jgi:hypothetical protein
MLFLPVFRAARGIVALLGEAEEIPEIQEAKEVSE